ncbi:MAG: NAD(P)H-binding protein, partial [Myxococcaceae bacterium]|nr:NAD(P)H-binding protein [Myxococcaceae bacterium]
ARARFGPTVPVVEVDLARPGGRLEAALAGAEHVVFTAGVPPGFARESTLEAVDFGGVRAAVEAARKSGLPGRFLYMTTMGLHRPTVLIHVLNFVKRNLVKWRLEAERAVLESGLDAMVLRAGLLTNGPASQQHLDLAPNDRAVSLATTVSRADVARILVAGLSAPRLPRDLSVFASPGEPTSDGSLPDVLARLAAQP